MSGYKTHLPGLPLKDCECDRCVKLRARRAKRNAAEEMYVALGLALDAIDPSERPDTVIAIKSARAKAEGRS